LETALRRISRRAMLFLTLIFVIICGLALRRYGYAMHLPFVVVKYGGSVLWGAMVYALLATIVAGTKPSRIAAAALIVAVAVEFFRLVHTPWLDAFRLTIAGALLLGRVFSLWNILAYVVGTVIAFAFDLTFSRTRDAQ
jgi:hypothetical protein